MFARVAEWAVVSAHYAAMAFIVFGGFLIWRWRWTMWPHAAIIVWAIFSLVYPVVCPLTWLENYFRHMSGRGNLSGGFIDTYITGVFYPSSFKEAALLISMLVVVVSWVGAYTRWRHARHVEVDSPGVDTAKFG
ncbi:MAG: DUF2784 domain-containing protein [Sciscionella sp.]